MKTFRKITHSPVQLTEEQKGLLLFAETEQKYGYKIEDLSRGSTYKVIYKCEVCGKPKEDKFKVFLKGLGLSHRKCSWVKREQTCIKEYGVKHISQCSTIKEKKRQTSFQNHSTSGSISVQEKRKHTNLLRRGVEWPMQSLEVRKKAKCSFIEHYGVEHPRQIREITEQQAQVFHQTWLKKKGINCSTENVNEAILQHIQSEFQKEGYILLSTKYVGHKSKLDILCPKGHFYDATWNDWQFSHARCSVCRESKGEKRLRQILERIYPEKTIRPQDNLDFLGQQEVDFSARELSLAFEYDGEQHFRPVRFGGMTQERAEEVFVYVQERDKKKDQLCKENGYKLIRVRYDENLNEELVRQKVSEALTRETSNG